MGRPDDAPRESLNVQDRLFGEYVRREARVNETHLCGPKLLKLSVSGQTRPQPDIRLDWQTPD